MFDEIIYLYSILQLFCLCMVPKSMTDFHMMLGTRFYVYGKFDRIYKLWSMHKTKIRTRYFGRHYFQNTLKLASEIVKGKFAPIDSSYSTGMTELLNLCLNMVETQSLN